MNTIDLALELELVMVPSEVSGLELASSDFDLPRFQLRHQLAECVLADFVDFRGISNPKRWAADECAVLPLALYEYAYTQDPAYQIPMCDIDECAATDSISDSDLKNNQGVRHGYDLI
jgi:hypothetical protein